MRLQEKNAQEERELRKGAEKLETDRGRCSGEGNQERKKSFSKSFFEYQSPAHSGENFSDFSSNRNQSKNFFELFLTDFSLSLPPAFHEIRFRLKGARLRGERGRGREVVEN